MPTSKRPTCQEPKSMNQQLQCLLILESLIQAERHIVIGMHSKCVIADICIQGNLTEDGSVQSTHGREETAPNSLLDRNLPPPPLFLSTCHECIGPSAIVIYDM
jgi:hypothetical protein